MQTNIGGDRLGSGNKQNINLRNYERSTHDLSYVWRSTMASGTLVPFINEVALPGDTFEIDLDADIKTHPTIGPLFGSYKVQLDVFHIPIRLYNAQLQVNQTKVGLKMSDLKLPLMILGGKNLEQSRNVNNAQINSSCLMSYLGIRGIGHHSDGETVTVARKFNAVPWLMYWDIYKDYYANKQEEKGVVIHTPAMPVLSNIDNMKVITPNGFMAGTYNILELGEVGAGFYAFYLTNQSKVEIEISDYDDGFNYEDVYWHLYDQETSGYVYRVPIKNIFPYTEWNALTSTLTCTGYRQWGNNPNGVYTGNGYTYDKSINEDSADNEPKLVFFDLDEIDRMKMLLLKWWSPLPFIVNTSATTVEPYKHLLEYYISGENYFASIQKNQEGLGIKTYQSDLFNNWISTEWIDGTNGINEITSIDTTSGSITIDELNISKKIYEMLNRIAISGGTYKDWMEATYSHEQRSMIQSPMYAGGLSKELVFQEVVSNAESSGQPLGTLAGRGIMAGKNKGGKVYIKIDEPSYIMGIVSLTPRIDYSQGNKWDVNLKTLDDLHKPALDGIGFQDLITDQMAYWDTGTDGDDEVFKSQGKQPAWINYMTNVNQVRGNFADENQQQFMVLDRRYETAWQDNKPYIKDLTTYIDPSKFNHIFANTRRDAQNFWTQIRVDMKVRRKMSAKIMPNL